MNNELNNVDLPLTTDELKKRKVMLKRIQHSIHGMAVLMAISMVGHGYLMLARDVGVDHSKLVVLAVIFLAGLIGFIGLSITDAQLRKETIPLSVYDIEELKRILEQDAEIRSLVSSWGREDRRPMQMHFEQLRKVSQARATRRWYAEQERKADEQFIAQHELINRAGAREVGAKLELPRTAATVEAVDVVCQEAMLKLVATLRSMQINDAHIRTASLSALDNQISHSALHGKSTVSDHDVSAEIYEHASGTAGISERRELTDAEIEQAVRSFESRYQACFEDPAMAEKWSTWLHAWSTAVLEYRDGRK